MDNKDEIKPSNQEPEKPEVSLLRQKFVSGARRVFSITKTVVRAVVMEVKEAVPKDEKIPLEKINIQSVAKVIDNIVSDPENEIINHNPKGFSFDITGVLTEMGYIMPSGNSDYREGFPNEYQATRKALWELFQLKALHIDMEEPNNHKENMYYRVINPHRLSEVARSTPESIPQ